MKRILILLVLSCSLLTVGAQHVNTLFFLENSPHRHYLNPALMPISKMYLGLPVIGYTSFNLSNSALVMGDLIYKKGSSTVTSLHPQYGNIDDVLKLIGKGLNTELDMQLSLLSFGWRTRHDGYVHITLNERIESNFGLPTDLFRFAFAGGMTDLTGENLYDLTNLGMNLKAYTELGVGYAQSTKNDKWTIGGKLKFLYGHAYASVQNSSTTLNASTSAWTISGGGNAMLAAPLAALPEQFNADAFTAFSIPSNIIEMALPQGLGGAIDLGFTYRPHKMVQISAALTDLGAIYWNRGMQYDYTLQATYDGIGDLTYPDVVDENGQFNTNIGGLLDTLANDVMNGLQSGESKQGFWSMVTPRLNIAVDANFWENRIGVGIVSQTRYANKRFYEEVTVGAAFRPCHWFQLAASYSILNGKSSNVGAALGFVTYEGIGLTLAADYVPCVYADVNGIPVPYKTPGINLAFGLNIVIGHKQDKDKDGVNNKYDLCPETPRGVVVDENGCPIDSDGDGVPDYLDQCPATPTAAYGYVNEHGCLTDTDADGVPDYLDKCPNTPAEAIGYLDEYGCLLDTDGDEVPDYLDKCPGTPAEAKGFVDAEGCLLDTDGDGVPDYLDKCPNTPAEAIGFLDEYGCPLDTDGDGVPDYLDQCPNTPLEAAGHIDANGCEIDTDGDGVPDWKDNCPTVAGLADNNGCPAVKREVRNLLTKAMQGIQFETGKAKIKKSSYKVLDQIAQTFIDNPTFHVEVQGHTDNVGNPKSNLKLSQDRADAVRDYLIKKGVPENQLVAKGYGDTMPIADNKTKAGRSKNRRVEFKITFEEVKIEEVRYTNDSTYTTQIIQPDTIKKAIPDSLHLKPAANVVK